MRNRFLPRVGHRLLAEFVGTALLEGTAGEVQGRRILPEHEHAASERRLTTEGRQPDGR
jgi:hypothetical protein